MTTKLLKGALTRFAVMAIAAVFFTPLATAAVASGEIENPVTGETETYVNTFTGGAATEWNSAGNWDTGNTPFISGNYDPALVNGAVTVSTSTAIDGWALRVGAYNGAKVTWSGGITKIQAGDVGCWLTADETSSITLAFNGNSKQLEGSDAYPFKLSSANAGGITWTSGLADAGNTSLPFWYYLKGAGTVVYGGDITVANAQVIKQADVTLSGNATKSVQSKTLVTFGSGTTKTFSADATIKRLDSDGTDLDYDVHLAAVTTGSTTLTTDSAVGTCELVQTSTGIDLYWVDGDPDDIPPPAYKPSININFISSANYGLTTAADVGLSGYAVPGTSWNNFAVANTTFSSVNAVDSTGTASEATGVSVTVSGTRGAYSCSTLAAATNPLHGYIDENGENPTPTITISGIPYSRYRVIVYHATDSANVPFGYDTINGTDYTYVDGALTEGAAAWGASGGADSANAIAEGVNVLVTGEFIESSLTVVAHRAGGSSNARGCIAAIQIIDVTPAVGENDLEIPVSGDTTYTVDTARNLTGTVYLTGNGTLTLDGSAKISAAFVNVGPGVTLNVNADRLDAPTFTGAGTVVFDGVKPTAGKGWTDSSAWAGTVWVKNIPVDSKSAWTLADYGNAKSTLRFTDVNLYFATGTTAFPGTVDLDGTGMNVCDGFGGSITTIARLTGSGTLSTGGGSSNGNGLTINDASAFTGAITLTKFKVIIGTSTGTSASGVLQIDAGAVATVASGTTWTAPGGFVVNGTLNDNGTLTSSASAAVTGSGTVVFTGRAPTPTGEAWWINGGWQGTVAINNVGDLVGRATGFTGTYLDFNSYGNAGSVIKLGTITGWLGNETCNVPVNLAGTLTINNGISGEAFTFKKLISNGGYITAPNQSATSRIVIEDGSEYAGYIGLNAKMVVFGTANPDFVKGQIYVSSNATITVPSVNTAFWAVGNIVVDGELKADGLARFGGGTSITTTDNGVFTLTSTGNGTENETEIDYARIKGTGTLKYDGTGWRALSTNNFPTTVTLVNEQAGDILLSRALTYSVGSLAGTKNLQGNYGSGARYLRVIQSQDTEWSGIVVSDGQDRFKGLTVAPGATAGTLTLSGNQVKAQTLTVESGAKVNLTGTWVGATTVAGTIGGTGTLTGDLTLTDGATLKVNDISDLLDVSGSLTAMGDITIELPEGAEKGMVITTGSKPDISGATFTTKIGGVEKKLKVTAAADGLKVGVQSLLIRIR